MDWQNILVEVAQLGLLAVAFWIPYRMARGGIKSPWPILAGWLAFAGLGIGLAFVGMLAMRSRDHDLINSFIEGPHAMILVLFGWAFAAGAASVGKRKRDRINGKHP